MEPSTKSASRKVKLTGVLYDKKMSLKLKSELYEVIIRLALTHGRECWAMNSNNTRQIAPTEVRMFRGILGVSRLEHIRNEEIRRQLNVPPIDEIVRIVDTCDVMCKDE